MKRSPLKRGRRKPKPRLQQDTAEAAVRRWEVGTFLMCACGCGRRAVAWHHIFDQNRYPELADAIDNIVPVARPCHEAHESAATPFQRRICAYAEALATTTAMENYLDRTYSQS